MHAPLSVSKILCNSKAAMIATCTSLQALKQAGVPYVVAPYEADAQLAYMARCGIVDLVITEDSDLLAYGCPEVVFKLSRGGDCDHIRVADLPMNRTLSFSGLDHDNFIEVSAL
jgi:exonuclease 1